MCDSRRSITKARHDCVQWRLVRAILSTLSLDEEENMRMHKQIPTDFNIEHRIILKVREGVIIYVDSEVPYLEDRRRPDILYIDETRKIAHIIDVSVAVEDTPHAFDNAREERNLRYADLKTIFQQKGFNSHLNGFVMGALGSFDINNMPFLRELSLPPLHSEMLIRFLCSRMIGYACEMYHSYFA